MTLRALLLATALAAAAAGQAQAALVISSAATANVACGFHVCGATAVDAVLNLRDLTSLLATGDTTVIASGGANDLKVESPVGWSNAQRLTLDAPHSIRIDRAIEVKGGGQMWLTTNDGGSGGTLSFGQRGNVRFWDLSSALTINSQPYILVGDLVTLASVIAAHPVDAYVALANDYDAAADGTYAAAPVPTPWAGGFEGLGHTISHLRIVTPAGGRGRGAVGLFANVGGGNIENFALTDVVVRSGSTADVGAVAGIGDANFVNLSVKGTVIGRRNSSVGGLVGSLQRSLSIVSSSSAGTVTVTAGGSAGGLAGSTINASLIQASHSTAAVSGGTGSAVGGLVGAHGGQLNQSWASGAVTTGDRFATRNQASAAGGLAGTVFLPSGQRTPTIVDCYATGAVTSGSGSHVGGLVGYSNIPGDITPIVRSYSLGAVTTGTDSAAGGLLGFVVNGTGLSLDYWDTTTSGIADPFKGVGNIANAPGVAGLTDTQLKSGLPTGFNGTIWALDPGVNGGRPFLLSNPPG